MTRFAAFVTLSLFFFALSNVSAQSQLLAQPLYETYETPQVQPIELSHFEVRREGMVLILTWGTTAEHFAQTFEIQRSVDGAAFESLAEVSAKGKDSEYFLTDHEPSLTNRVRYRILASGHLLAACHYDWKQEQAAESAQ